ncbi:Fe-only nitrogenase subunit delta [Rhodospirillum rubrum]|uniref:Fe-only nitrogenase subunit delta n=1 Tax=Rhodospirillum rubrum TaxID=1085 RepID=UPI00190345D5|nr:Fe-only nitrogenase subunit delta [Rhodospirillum rubrum]MBK1662934.1 Fe-only nitrogenase subunit delta [Rhodospirillum rubrum]MBK1675221.1 Fe-only nitrogenase subunit delta [Rhodospirillum rubrum]
MDDLMKDRIDLLIDYIMKHCLWQFHSRSWDRKRQNEEILKKTTEILCDEPVDLGTPADKCYWVDAVCLADAYKSQYPWLKTMDKDAIKTLMRALHERLDHLTITGSLNLELTDQQY